MAMSSLCPHPCHNIDLPTVKLMNRIPTLFDPIQLGAISIRNRIVMSPLTRARASRDHIPIELMAEYYAQRASAGLIISEATGISQEGLGWPYAPGIWTIEQISAWKCVTQAVHRAGGVIVCQLWHMGRLVHPDFLAGQPPVSSSATIAPADAHTYAGKQAYTLARALDADQVLRVVDDFRVAARNAMEAGFDGVELHAANGYLIDQFLRDSANLRTDRYGGSISNRLRFLAEIVAAIDTEIGSERLGVRLSPNGEIQGVIDSDPAPLFIEVARMLDSAGIAFLEVRERRPDGTFGRSDQPLQAETMRKYFRGPMILNGDFDESRAKASIEQGEADAISFGRPFISNPDFPIRLRDRLPIAPLADPVSWYGQSEKGYTDFTTAAAADEQT